MVHDITYYDTVLRQIHVMCGENPHPDSIVTAVMYCSVPYWRIALWYGVIFFQTNLSIYRKRAAHIRSLLHFFYYTTFQIYPSLILYLYI